MPLNLNVQLSVVRRGPLDVTAYATRSTVVGNQGVVFYLDGPDLKRIGSEGYEVVWDMGDYRDLVLFPTLETIWPDQYPRALRAIGGLTMGRYRGPICAHCFGGPAGTYQVTCTIRNRAGVAQTILVATITKQDPNAVYAGTNTICYSTSGNFTGAPAGSQQITVADGIVTRALFTSADRRILFRSGETFIQDIAMRDANQVYIGTFGGDAPANLTRGFLINTGPGPHQNMVLDNLSIDIGYDPAAPNRWWEDTPAPSAPQAGVSFVSGTNVGMTLHRVSIKGCYSGIHMLGSQHVFFDCGITDFFDFGIFEMRDKSVMVGSFSAQNPSALNVNMTAGGVALPSNRNAWNATIEGSAATALAAHSYFGPNGECPNWPRHGPFRNIPCDVNCINRSALINGLPGWSGHPQPAIRWMREANSQDGYGSLVDSYFRGGFGVVRVNELGSVPARFILLDAITVEVDNNAWYFWDFYMGNVWARNCLLLMPEGVSLNTPQSTFGLLDAGTTTGIAGDGLFIDNCTFALRGNLTTRNVIFDADIGGQSVTYRNNLQIRTATNPGSVSIPASMVEVTSMTGFNSDYSPQIGNATVSGKALGVAPLVDFDGVTRGTPGAIGALEPK